MKIKILDDAQEDLIQGFRFYEIREPGLGSYFLDCLFSDLDSHLLCPGIHLLVFSYYGCLSNRFLVLIYSLRSWMHSVFLCPHRFIPGTFWGQKLY